MVYTTVALLFFFSAHYADTRALLSFLLLSKRSPLGGRNTLSISELMLKKEKREKQKEEERRKEKKQKKRIKNKKE